MKGSDLILGWFDTTRIVVTIEISGDLKSGVGAGGASIVEDFLVGIQRFARPVSRNFGKQSMLDGIPLGSAHSTYTVANFRV